MGECVNLRCAQEKRQIKGKLSLWYKKVPYTIGLELVAENLAGGSSGHIKTLLLPFNDMEPDEAEDFKPPSDLTCIHCEGKPSEPPEPELSLEKIIKVEQATPKINAQQPLCRDENKGTNFMAGSIPDLNNLEGLSSLYSQLAMSSLLYSQQQQFQNVAVQAAIHAGASSSAQGMVQSMIPSSAITELKKPGDLALDLRATPSAPFVAPENLLLDSESDGLRVPEIHTKKKKDNSPKKAYSNEELDAAVKAIKSGTIGTRRAAQIFGVPRSTLRNKVVKSAEMNRQLPEAHELSTGATASNFNCSSPPALSKKNGELQSLEQISKQISPETTGNENHHSLDNNMTQYHQEALKQLDELKAKGMQEHISMVTQQSRLMGEMFNPLQFAAAAGYNPFFMPQYSALGAMPGLDYMNPYAASSMMMPYLPELFKNLAQKQLDSERANHISGSRQTSSNRSKSEQVNGSSKAAVAAKDNEDIKVPAYKPSALSQSNISPISAAKNADQHVPLKEKMDMLSGFSATNYLQNMISQSSTSKRSAPRTTNTTSKKPFIQQASPDAALPHSQHTHSSLSNGNSSGKKRPKRGQYRKYDSELLAQAVKAVQRGEMSVHRAGTYYGVPHSTLEYKVKERHLLRKKKMAENGENKANPASETSASKPPATVIANNSSSDSFQFESKALASPKLNADEISKSSPEVSESNSPNLLSFPSTYNLSTPASELLMKLHARAHQKANEIMNNNKSQDSNGTKESLQIS